MENINKAPSAASRLCGVQIAVCNSENEEMRGADEASMIVKEDGRRDYP
ncbi:hypothetical protein [Undibacterium sp. RuTC16W]